MNYISKEIIDLYVFDENGKFVAALKSLHESRITQYCVVVKDALLNSDLLSFIGKEEESTSTDYEKILLGDALNKKGKCIVLGKSEGKKCKLIAKSILRDQKTGMDINVKYEIPNAIISSDDFEIDNNIQKVSDFDFVFGIKPFNEQGDKIKMYIEDDFSETGVFVKNLIQTTQQNSVKW